MTIADHIRILNRRAALLRDKLASIEGDGMFARVSRRHVEEDLEQVEDCIRILEGK